MNDQEADSQVQQMISFILNEAKTSAAETQKKAMEDYSVEKLKLVQSMKENIRVEFDTMKKKSVTTKAIERSTAINRARLSKIEARHQCIEILGKDCEKRLAEAMKAQDKYKMILVDLIVQGCLKLTEPTVSVKARAADAALVKSVLDAASAKYSQVIKKETGANLSLKLGMDKEVLSATCLGGVILSCQDGTILVDNTLNARLNLVMESERPALRKMLFPGA